MLLNIYLFTINTLGTRNLVVSFLYEYNKWLGSGTNFLIHDYFEMLQNSKTYNILIKITFTNKKQYSGCIVYPLIFKLITVIGKIYFLEFFIKIRTQNHQIFFIVFKPFRNY